MTKFENEQSLLANDQTEEQLEEDSYGSSTALLRTFSYSAYRHCSASNNIATGIDVDSKYNMYYHRNCYHCMMNRNNLGVMLLRENRYMEAANCFCDSVKYINERSEYNSNSNSSSSSSSRNCYHHNGYQGTANSATTKFDFLYWLSEDTRTNHCEEEDAAVNVAPTNAANEEVPTNTSTFLFRNPIVISERPHNSTAGKSRTPLTDETDDANSSSSVFFDKGSCLRLSSMSVYNMALTYHLAALDSNGCNNRYHQSSRSSKYRNSNFSKRRRSSTSNTCDFSSPSSLSPSSSQPLSSKRRRIIDSNNRNETVMNQKDRSSCIIDDKYNSITVGKNKYHCYCKCYDDDTTISRRGTARRVAIGIPTNSSPSLTKTVSATETVLGPSASGNSDSSSSSSGITNSTNGSSRTFLLRQALTYYDMAYGILISNNHGDDEMHHGGDGGVLISQAMVLLNNMGHIHRLLDDESKATSCFRRLLTTMMYVQLQDEDSATTSSSSSTSSVSSSSSNLRQRICHWDRFVDNVIDLMIDNVDDDDDDDEIGDITNTEAPRSCTLRSRRRRRLAKVATAA